ncbi:putative sperm motility kinase W [Chionomys nivalis]|uniref:putative sperm motility kinase W n=1 Tax=Chionomys nivalis TaxID=269649 RepID=UPI0025972DFA|nr:putative sperm motility kinase W [Chionomys nivalis]
MACLPQDGGLDRQYKMLFTIGQGGFGYVQLAFHRLTGMPVAIKVVENLKKHLHLVLSEIAVLETVQHPHIIRLFQVLTTTKYCYIITEYASEGNLYELVKEEGRLQEEQAQVIFGQLVSAIRCCHDHDIVHRDLKPPNILLDAHGNVKLGDFGLATRCRAGTKLHGRCGTKSYNAPEMVLREGYDGKKADVWSVGVLLYFMTTGHHPFKGSTLEETKKNIAIGMYDIPAHISGQLENLIHQILTVIPERRPSIEDIQHHPWVKNPEENISSDPYPNPKIVDKLFGHGFAANEIFDSLQKRKYDEIMGTYLLLQEQEHQGLDSTSSVTTVDHCPAPPPSPIPPLTSGRYLKRRASEPTFGLLHTRPSQQDKPDVLTLSGQKINQSVSMPLWCPQKINQSVSTPLWCPQKKSPTSSHAPPTKAASAPCVYHSRVEEEMPLLPGPDSNMEKSCLPQNIGCLCGLCRRIRVCLSRLCCFPRASNPQTGRVFNNKVAPLKESPSEE